MGCALTAPKEEIDATEQKQILTDNIDLKQQLSDLQQEKDQMLRQKNNLNPSPKQQNNYSEIYKLQNEILSLKSQSKSKAVCGMKNEIVSLENENKQKQTEILQHEYVTLTQLSDIRAMELERNTILQEFKEYESMSSSLRWKTENPLDWLKYAKVSILNNFLQLNDNKTAITLLFASKWNVREAIDEYYIIKHKIDIEYEQVWQWKDDNNAWKRYNDSELQLIRQLNDDVPDTLEFSRAGTTYSFHKICSDFGEQINLKTNKKRETRKVKLKINKSDNIQVTEIWEWQNDKKNWVPYNQQQTKHISQMEVGAVYTFCAGKSYYRFCKLSVDYGEQINTATKYKRVARKREIQKINAVRYPDFWSDDGCYYHDFDKKKLYYQSSEEIALEEDYTNGKLIAVQLNSKIGQQIQSKYYQSVCKKSYRIYRIESVQNKYLWDKYETAKKSLSKRIGDKRLNEQYLWYGGDAEMIKMITMQGYRKEYFPPQCPYGEGVYFALEANQWADNFKSLIYCKVLCGESKQGLSEYKLTKWPVKNDASGQLYDSLVNSIRTPTMYVIHDDIRAYPMYIVRIAKRGH